MRRLYDVVYRRRAAAGIAFSEGYRPSDNTCPYCFIFPCGLLGKPKANRVKLDVLKEFLRFWVAFSVVDEGGVGRVNAEDLKVTL